MRKAVLLALFTALSLAVTVLAAGCSGKPGSSAQLPDVSATALTPLPDSMKGYELYSWQADDQWYFTLVTGTNRQKTIEEITTGEDVLNADGWTRLSVQGLDALKAMLGRLPAGEEVFWAGELAPGSGIVLPPQDMIEAVKEFCLDKGLLLSVSE